MNELIPYVRQCDTYSHTDHCCEQLDLKLYQ